MNCILLQAAQLNQTGASYLASHHLGSAFKCFQTALELAGDAGSEQHWMTCDIDGLSLDAHIQLLTIPQEITNEKETCGCNEGYIYSKPFFFNPAMSSMTTTQDVASYGGVILFNLALTFHKRSKLVGESYLSVALNLYEKCLSLLRRHNSHFDCSNIIIAALHNQARIYEELSDYQNAAMKFRYVAELLQMGFVRKDTLETEDLNCMCLNITCFTFPTCAASA